MMSERPSRAYWFVIAAAILWGTIGIFVRILSDQGFQPGAIAFIRLFFGFVVLSIYLLVIDPKKLIIDFPSLAACAFVGIVTQAGFNLAYVKAISLNGVSLSAVLLNLAPLFLLAWSVIFFQEGLTIDKALGIVLCVSGAALAVTGGRLAGAVISFQGILMGILSAFFYSLMTVFSRLLLKRIPALTLITYSFLFGALFTIPTLTLNDLKFFTSTYNCLSICLAMGVIPAALAYILYFEGMSMEPNLAMVGVLSTLELVFSLIFAYFVFGESISYWGIIGVAMILLSIVISSKPGLPIGYGREVSNMLRKTYPSNK